MSNNAHDSTTVVEFRKNNPKLKDPARLSLGVHKVNQHNLAPVRVAPVRRPCLVPSTSSPHCEVTLFPLYTVLEASHQVQPSLQRRRLKLRSLEGVLSVYYWDSSASDNSPFPRVCLITMHFAYLLFENLPAEWLKSSAHHTFLSCWAHQTSSSLLPL